MARRSSADAAAAIFAKATDTPEGASHCADGAGAMARDASRSVRHA